MLYRHRIGCARKIVINGVTLRKVSIVFQLIHSKTQRGLGLFVVQNALQTGVNDFRERIVIPPKVARMIMPIIECGIEPIEERTGSESYRVAEKSEVEIGRTIDFQLPGILSHQPCFGRHPVMECFSLRFAKLSTDTNIVFVVAFGSSLCIGECEMAQFAGQKRLQT